ncbi:MAG: hypothetical protein OXU64_06460 [Gemmatimonadota bacterium]|nr:hypothetical protein [Gemmatimonadota bacterium]
MTRIERSIVRSLQCALPLAVVALVGGWEREPPVPTTVTVSPDSVTVTQFRDFEYDDRAVLLKFYEATGGTGWRTNTNWATDAPLDTWYGVKTDSQGKVTELDLGENSLTGTIPLELLYLQDLVRLLLHWNELTGPIHPEFGNLRNLVRLSLSGNRLTGPIPPELGTHLPV